MNAVFIVSLILLAGLVVFALCKLGTLESRIDDIYNKSFIMQGEIEANTARSQDNYKLIAKVNTELENTKIKIAELHKQEHADDTTKEVEEELESLVPEREEVEQSDEECELAIRREKFAIYRKQGMDIKSAGVAVGVSYSTAKRYEQWRKDNKK